MECRMRMNIMRLVRMAACGTIFSLVGFGVTAQGQGQQPAGRGGQPQPGGTAEAALCAARGRGRTVDEGAIDARPMHP